MDAFNLRDYQNRLLKIINNLQKISNSANALHVQDEQESLLKTIKEVQDDTFNVVVVGEFSRGKSTFINAMIGEKLLPSSKLPTTAILNKIHFNETPQFHIHYRKNNQIQAIDQDSFNQLIAPPDPIEGDQTSIKEYEEHLAKFNEIAYANIGYPTGFCENKVEIVDTPGTNDLEIAREEITYKFIPESDAAIFILSAKQQFSDSEKRFLKDRIISNDIQKIFFVINFKDRLRTERDQEEVIDYVHKHVKEVINEEPRIYLLSAKGALNAKRVGRGEKVKGKVPDFSDTGFGAFEQDLALFLSNERGATKLWKPIERGIKSANHLIDNSINISRGSLTLTLEELEKKVGELNIELSKARSSSSQALQRLKSLLMQGGQDFHQDIETELGRIANRAVQAVDRYSGSFTKEDFAKAIEDAVAPMQTSLQVKIKAKQQHLIEEIVHHMNRRLAKEWKMLDQKVAEALVLPESNNRTIMQGYDEINVVDSDVFIKTGLGSLGIFAVVAGSLGLGILAIPAAAFGGFQIFKHFEEKAKARTLGKLRNEVDRRYRDIIPAMLAKVDEQWNTVIDEMVTYYQHEIDSKLQTIENQMKQTLEERKQEAFKVEQKSAFLDEQERLLQDSITALRSISIELHEQNT